MNFIKRDLVRGKRPSSETFRAYIPACDKAFLDAVGISIGSNTDEEHPGEFNDIRFRERRTFRGVQTHI